MKYKNLVLKFCLLFSMVLLSGCATLPYGSDFNCPQKEKGMCASVQDVHEIAVSEPDLDKNAQERNRQERMDAEKDIYKKLKTYCSEDSESYDEDICDNLHEKLANEVVESRRERIDRIRALEEYRLQNITEEDAERVAISKPILLRVAFGRYKTKDGNVIGKHSVYKILKNPDIISPEVGVSDFENSIGNIY